MVEPGRIAVVGAGPAGAGFALELMKRGFQGELEIYERDPFYRKPCGDVVLRDVLEESPLAPRVLNSIRRFEIRVRGETVFEKEYRDPIWFVIDKPEWVRGMREKAVDLGASMHVKSVFPDNLASTHDTVVDARGPFANNGLTKLTISRALVEHPVDPEGVLIDFDPDLMGFLWVFPHERDAANIGLAYKGERSPHLRLERLLEREYGSPKVLRMDTTVITIDQPPRTPRYFHPVYPIGEAQGLVHPLSGEGIRPSHLHGLWFARRLLEEPHPRLAFLRAWDDINGFVAQMRFQKLLLELVESLPPGGARVEAMRMLSPRLYESFLRDSIRLSDVLSSIAANPRLLGVMAPGLAGLAMRLFAG